MFIVIGWTSATGIPVLVLHTYTPKVFAIPDTDVRPRPLLHDRVLCPARLHAAEHEHSDLASAPNKKKSGTNYRSR